MRSTCAALLAALALLAPGAPAAANDDPPPLASAGPRLLKTPGRDHVWLVAGGRRQWIADLATFRARGYRWPDVELAAPAVLYAFPLLPADHAGPLLRVPGTGEVYLVADGQTRLVPDLVSFEAYGLDWRKVETVDAATLARYARGAPLPHFVAGPDFPEAPKPVPPAAAAGPGPGGQGAAAAAAAPVDGRLRAALNLIEAYPPTAAWPAFLRDYGVALRFGAVPGGQASYRATDRTLTVDDKLADLDPRGLATLLVHETVHAIYDARGSSGKSGRACIDEEAHAFAVQSAFWAHHHGLAGVPAPGSAVERELNQTLQWALDDALPGKVLTTWAYTLRCYFPEATTRPDEAP
jgi:hypothetical protein